MKNIKVLVVLVVLAGMLILGCQWSNTYERKGTVIKIENEIVRVESKDGNVWGFEGTGYHTGQAVTLVMDNNNTDKIEDDKIIDVK